MQPFSFLSAGRIIFGRGSCDQSAALVCSYGTDVLLVRGRSVSWVDAFADELRAAGCRVTEIHNRTEPDLPSLEAALNIGRAAESQVVVAVGGGSVIDLGKAVAALLPGQGAVIDHFEGVGDGQPLNARPLPFVAVPTTSGTGAEVTKNAVILVPDAGRKVSLRDDRMLPDVALVDPALTDNTPRQVTLASGLDAVTQCIEPWLCNRSNPLTDALCAAAVPEGFRALRRLSDGEDAAARDSLSWCSLAGGLSLANSGLGAVHGLAGVLGGRVGAPHGLICGRLLGPVLKANEAQMRREGTDTQRFEILRNWIAEVFRTTPEQAFSRISVLPDEWGLPGIGGWVSPDISMTEIASEAAGSSSMRANPCVLENETLSAVLKSAL